MDPHGSARILLAEDHGVIRRMSVRLLERLGFSVAAVENGEEVLEALAETDYDLVLMDVRMPDMDGFTATGKIRSPDSRVRNHRIPIIAMTGSIQPGDRARCLSAGMNDFLAKPFGPEALVEMVNKWLPADKKAGNVASDNSKVENREVDPVFDRASFRRRLLNNAELEREIGCKFLDDMPRQLAAIRAAAMNNEIARVEFLAHTIMGAAAYVSGENMRRIALTLEQAAKSGVTTTMQTLLAELEDSYEKLRSAMNAGLNLENNRH